MTHRCLRLQLLRQQQPRCRSQQYPAAEAALAHPLRRRAHRKYQDPRGVVCCRGPRGRGEGGGGGACNRPCFNHCPRACTTRGFQWQGVLLLKKEY